ncbi:MAG: carbamoyltransferase N-terminal domain-containing protein, partial [Bdellovibrionota bacterium]
MIILGLSYGYHDASASLVRDGIVVASAAEERFTRLKHDSSFPQFAIEFCLKKAGISVDQVNRVVLYEQPTLKWT